MKSTSIITFLIFSSFLFQTALLVVVFSAPTNSNTRNKQPPEFRPLNDNPIEEISGLGPWLNFPTGIPFDILQGRPADATL
ncbi:unnamed protein product [Adineta steineri]|uniref:Uncharacterized protein n=1 Tax=Adineta steineri TaxID=433720 RepID=A0A814UC10_9BILA|nr:unnamed protein product [Adineta steineri]CAF1172392.1 unnamed protein product [Adineta steineri]CAF3755582.1 unnamed protein product [Adineta steineri]CAF3975260.1 unnamed protein product [Adineta steineri]